MQPRTIALWAAVAIAGALGALARYVLSAWVARRWGNCAFPWGTWLVNILGAFVLGFAYAYTSEHELPGVWQTAFTSGFIGAFTTFSTFNYEAWVMLSAANWGPGLLYLASSWLLGLAAVAAGMATARVFAQAIAVAVTAALGLGVVRALAGRAPDGTRPPAVPRPPAMSPRPAMSRPPAIPEPPPAAPGPPAVPLRPPPPRNGVTP